MTLLFGWMQNHSPSVEAIARAGYSHGLKVSAQGMDKRFTKTAGEFMKSVLEEAVAQVICASSEVNIEILRRFTAVYVADCSTVALPTELEDVWQGVGGSGNVSQAALKLDTRLELKTGQLHFGLLPGRHSDSKGMVAQECYEKGSLRLQDLGYFNLARMKEQGERGEYWISRLQPRTQIFSVDECPIDLGVLLQTLHTQGVLRHEMYVKVGVVEQLEARLLLWKLPQEAAAKRRAKMLDNGRKHGRQPSSESLAWCDWNIHITNVESEKLSHNECFLLYTVRWQIELLFKLWKSHSGLGHSRSEKAERMLCEIYAKLLSVLVQHWIVLTGLWRMPNRSLVKGCQMIKEQSACLANCIDDFDSLVQVLKELAKRFEYGCALNKRKKNPNTCQLLGAGEIYS